MAELDENELPFSRKSGAKQLVRSIISLPELPMRVAMLAQKCDGNPELPLAECLDLVVASSQIVDDARECMLALAIVFAQKRESAWLWSLHQLAKKHALINLERALRPEKSQTLPPSPPQLREALELPLPNYGGTRPLSVGERKSLARRPTRVQLERLLHDPHPLVIEQLLQSPGMTEDDVVLIATRRPAHVPALDLLIGSARWITRRRIRLSLVLNPGTPHGIALPFLFTCLREDLQLIVETTTTSLVIRTVARELYLRLPPLQTEIQIDGLH